MVLTKAVDTGLEAAALVVAVVVPNVSLTMIIIHASFLIISSIISDGSGNQGYAGGGDDTQGRYGDGGGGCEYF